MTLRTNGERTIVERTIDVVPEIFDISQIIQNIKHIFILAIDSVTSFNKLIGKGLLDCGL